MRCLLCGSKEVWHVLEVKGRSIFKCDNCKSQFAHPMREYKGAYVANNLYNPRYGWFTFKRQSGIIKKMVGHGRILDYGCGGGHFLSHFGDGVVGRWFKYGIEMSDEARDVALGKGIRVFSGLDDADFKDGFFDVVTMFAVIEHLMSPRKTIQELSRVLKSNGLLTVMTGDVTSKKAVSKGGKWHIYVSPEHFYFFSAKGLDMLMVEHGYRKIKSMHTDGGMCKIPYADKIPLLNKLPLFDHYYGYYRKVR